MPNWIAPTVSDLYTDWPTLLQAKSKALATMFNDGLAWTSLDVDTIRWSSTNSRFEKWNGSSWVNLSSALTDVLHATNNLSDIINPATARANLGLGTISVLNIPLALNYGGTGGTDAPSARSGLGLGTISVQPANSVAITGGSITGLATLSMVGSSVLNMGGSSTIGNCSYYNNGAAIEYATVGADYKHNWKTNSVSRMELSSAGLDPATDLGLTIGASSLRWSTVYAQTVNTDFVDNDNDIAIRYNGTTYWLFGSGVAKDFRPNSNGLQSLGFTSYWWGNCYLDTIIGRQTFIQMSAGGGDAQIRYAAGPSGEHYFYNASGGTLLFVIENTGKINPYAIGRPSYGTGTYTPARAANGTSMTVNQLGDVVSTMINDLKAVGVFG